MKILEQNEIVEYEGDQHTILAVWNHGGRNVFYDLQAVNPNKGTDYKRISLSVYHTEVTLVTK